ncbi:MAG: ComEC/Rec2 family competence protein [Sphingobacteriaceae bacterium]
MHKGEIPFVRLLLPFISGILLGWYAPNFCSLRLCVGLLISSCILLFLSRIFHKKYPYRQFRWFLGLLIIVFLFALAIVLTAYPEAFWAKKKLKALSPKTLCVQVSTEPIAKEDILRFEADVWYADSQEIADKLLIALKVGKEKLSTIAYGDVLLIPANNREVEPPFNPGEFDYRWYLRTHGIEQQSFIQLKQVRKIASGQGNRLIDFALRLRKTIIKTFVKYVNSAESAAMASTLIMGYRADLSPDLVNAYAQTGTLHVLSVSGMHVALVFLLLSFLLKPLDRVFKNALPKAVLLVAMIWFYALLSGFSPSVNRAALMLSLVVLGKAINKRMNTYNLLAVSAFILLIINPLYLFDVGFQLSYLAVLGLVAVHPYVYGWFYVKNKALDAVWSYTALSISAQVFTFPLSVYVFHQFPLSFLLSNLAIVLPITAVMYVGVGFVLLLPITVALPYMGRLLSWLIQLSNQLLFHIAKLPHASIQGVFIDKVELFVLYGLSILVLLAFVNKSKKMLFLVFILLLFLGGYRLCKYFNKPKSTLIFYSLRKNTALVYAQANNYLIVSDLSPTDKAFQFSVKPSLSMFENGLWVKPGAKFRTSICYSNGTLLFLGTHKLLYWSPRLNKLKLTKKLEVNTLLIGQNPNINLKDICSKVRFNRLLVDATNPDYKIKQWLLEAKHLGIPLYVLKKNDALILYW